MKKFAKKAILLLTSCTGSMVPLVVAVAVAILFLILGVSEYMRLVIIAAGVEDAMESAIVSTVNDNYDEVYHSVREGYAAGYEPTGAGFREAVDYGDIYGRLCFLLGLEEDGDGYTKTTDGEKEYRISNLQVSVSNPALATEGEAYYADGEMRLEVPVRFAGKMVAGLSIRMKVRAAYQEKF